MKTPPKEYKLMQLQPEHKAAMMLLQQEVMDALPDKRWYFPSEEWEFDENLMNGDAFGYLKGDTLCSFAELTPAESRAERSYARVLGHESAHTFDFHDVMVLPAYRGKGMHQAFLKLFETMARAAGGTAIYATVDPENGPSRHNFEKAGYELVLIKTAYDGRPRCYFRLDLTKPEGGAC